MLGKLRETIYEQYAEHFTYATRIRGRLKANGSDCQCLFVMPRETEAEYYFLERLFGNEWCRSDQRRIWIRQATQFARELPAGIDFCVAALPLNWNRLFAPLTEYRTHLYLRQSIDLTGDWSDIKGRFRSKSKRTDFNKFSREQQFKVRVSHDDADFDFFYSRIYLPHIQKFGKAAKIPTAERLRSKYSASGFLILIEDEGVDVAGALITVEGDTMHCLSDGVVDGDPALVKRGMLSALYVASLRYAKERNLSIVDLGWSRPFLCDGVYRHKRSWGARVSISGDQEEAIYFFDPAHSENFAAFLKQNPLIVTTDDEHLMGLCMLGHEDGGDMNPLDRILEDNCAPGLEGMIVLDSESQTSRVLPFPGQHRETKPAKADLLLSSKAA
jgi:hypothetical protein